MAVIHNHYKILGISPNANLTAIHKAVLGMKNKDVDGNYTATLNMIEQILSDPVQRKQYDDSIELPESERTDYKAQEVELYHQNKQATPAADFLDIQESDARRYQNHQRLAKHFPEPEPPAFDEDLHFPTVFPWKKFFLLLLLVGLGVGGYLVSKPLYYEYQTYQQADEALNDLFLARDQVIQYIRENKVFPTSIPNFHPSGSLYTVELTAPPNQYIELMFTSQAAKKLRGGSYRLEPYEIPNMGLNWRCSTGRAFPADYKPARCF